jgi:hypothetical protein
VIAAAMATCALVQRGITDCFHSNAGDRRRGDHRRAGRRRESGRRGLLSGEGLLFAGALILVARAYDRMTKQLAVWGCAAFHHPRPTPRRGASGDAQGDHHSRPCSIPRTDIAAYGPPEAAA